MATVAGPVGARAPRRARRLSLELGRIAERLALLLPLAAGMAAWAVSLSHIEIDSLGEYGLPPALPPLWYAGAAILLVGTALPIALGARGRATTLYLIAIVVVLFATVPAISAEPHYAWVYKHIGVTRFLEANHTADPTVDIYNRWPGFFALTAVFSQLTGASNPVTYAGWAELFFTLLDVFLVRAAVRAVSGNREVADLAALLFAVGNWVGQDYFSPQALDYVLALATVTLVLALRGGGPAAGRRASGLLRRLFRGPPEQLPLERVEAPRSRVALVLAVLALDAASIPIHQLTPYVLLLQVAALALLGLFRPRWIVLPMAAMTVAYLVPNLGYVEHNFGIFSSFDPFGNAQRQTQYIADPLPGKLFNQRAGELLSLTVWVGALLATVRLTRQGLGRRAMPLIVLSLTPFAVLFGQSYGGEAVLRVMLFSLPWCAGLIAWGVATIERPLRRATVALAVCGGCLALFIPAFFGQEELNRMPSTEVRASEYFNAHARAGSVLLFSAPDFPGRFGSRYPLIRGPKNADDPTLLNGPKFRGRPLGSRDVPAVTALVEHYSQHGYVLFSTTQTEYAHVFQLTPDGALESCERAIASSPRFRLWYRNRDTRIYELVGGAQSG